MSAETKVDVSGLLRELPELLVIASTDPSSDRLIGVALRIRETESAVAELIEAATNASATLCHAYHTTLTGQLADHAHEGYQRLDAVLARIGGAA